MISPKFGTMYLFGPEKTTSIMQHRSNYLQMEGAVGLVDTEESRKFLKERASSFGQQETDKLMLMTGDLVFLDTEAKMYPFVADHQGFVAGKQLRAGLLENGQLFLATQTGTDDVTFWDETRKQSIRLMVEQNPHAKTEPNRQTAQAVYDNAVLTGRVINEVV